MGGQPISTPEVMRFAPMPADPACAYCSGREPRPDLGLDGYYCISLVEQDDRYRRACAEFHRVGLCSRVVFHRPERARNTDRGIWASHRAVAQEAVRRGEHRVLIMEDDVRFLAPLDRVATRLRRAMAALPDPWQIFFLGHVPFQGYFVARGVIRTRSTCLHAYIASKSGLRWLAAHAPLDPTVPVWRFIGPAIDTAVALLPGAYALFPMVALQVPLDDRRINSRVTSAGAVRRWNDTERFRHFFIFTAARPMQWLVAAGSPIFRLIFETSRQKAIARSGSRDAQRIRAAGLFDEAFYRQTYPDVAAADADPLQHYLLWGAAEGRWPNADFDPAAYWRKAGGPRAGTNPLIHFLDGGVARV